MKKCEGRHVRQPGIYNRILLKVKSLEFLNTILKKRKYFFSNCYEGQINHASLRGVPTELNRHVVALVKQDMIRQATALNFSHIGHLV